MESEIRVYMLKNGIEVGRSESLAHAEGHPNVGDLLIKIFAELTELSFSAVVKFALAGLADVVLPGLGALAAIEAARATISDANDAIGRIQDSSNQACRADATYPLQESDDFDEIRVWYHGWSEDNIKFGVPIVYKPGSLIEQTTYNDDDEHKYTCTITLNTRDLEEGLCPFAFGSVDKGVPYIGYDVAAISTLTLEWQKRPKDYCLGMRMANFNIDPPAPPHALRSLRELCALLDFCGPNFDAPPDPNRPPPLVATMLRGIKLVEVDPGGPGRNL